MSGSSARPERNISLQLPNAVKFAQKPAGQKLCIAFITCEWRLTMRRNISWSSIVGPAHDRADLPASLGTSNPVPSVCEGSGKALTSTIKSAKQIGRANWDRTSASLAKFNLNDAAASPRMDPYCARRLLSIKVNCWV